MLDEELDRLGERYRNPIVLCCLEGRSREEAARLLGWPVGTVNGRLSRAKELLRERLVRRGLVCSVTGLTALLSAHGATAVPAELSRATLAVVAGTVPAAVTGLAAGAASGWGRRATVAVVFGLAVTGGLVAYAVWFPPVPDQPRTPNLPNPPAAVRLAHGSEVLALAVSPGGLVATTGPGSEVRVWKPDGTPAARCAFPGGGAAVAFAPDGKTLAAAGCDGTVRVWDAKTGAVRHTFTGHGDSAQAVAFAPDGTRIATAGEEGRVRLWDADTGKHLRDLEGHRGRAESNRAACHANLDVRANVRRGWNDKPAPAGPPTPDLMARVGRVYGERPFCPDGGTYEVSADARSCRCSIHGGHDDPHQPAGPTAASSTGRVLKSFAGLTATVRFEEDGLRVVVTVDRKE